VTEASQTILVAFTLIGMGVTWQTIRTAQVPLNSPDRLVSELRLAQLAGLLLVLSAGCHRANL